MNKIFTFNLLISRFVGSHFVANKWHGANYTCECIAKCWLVKNRDVHPCSIPIGSMYGVYSYIHHKNSTIHVGKYTNNPWILWGYVMLSDTDGSQLPLHLQGPVFNVTLSRSHGLLGISVDRSDTNCVVIRVTWRWYKVVFHVLSVDSLAQFGKKGVQRK